MLNDSAMICIKYASTYKLGLCVILFFSFISWGCGGHSEGERRYAAFGEVLDVRDSVRAVSLVGPPLGCYFAPYVMGRYLIIADGRTYGKMVHLYDKESFEYICSTAEKGRGPGEITLLGPIAVDTANKRFYVSDHAKLQVFGFDVDSVESNPLYQPVVKVTMSPLEIPVDYVYVSDTECWSRIFIPIGTNDFKPVVGVWNMQTNKIRTMEYEHPGIKKKRVVTAFSVPNGVYAEAYVHYDLITVCSMNGDLKYNIYGPEWNSKNHKKEYYQSILFCKGNIVASYLDDVGYKKGKNGSVRSAFASKLVVFDLDGRYKKTLDVGCEVGHIAYDSGRNRLFFDVESEAFQFAYLDLEGLL